MLWNGTVAFWKTVTSILGKYAEVMFEFLSKTIVEDQLKFTVVGVVADKENAIRSLFGLLVGWRKWVFCLGFNAH